MKALILNSGMGTRMGVLTSEQPKCMTEIYGTETILARQLKQLAEYEITDVVITTGAHNDVLRNYVSSLGLELRISFVLNEDYRSTNYIYSIYKARDLLYDDIVLMHGDLVFENGVLEQAIESDSSCMVVSSTAPLPEKDFKAVIAGGRIKRIGIDCFDSAMAAQPLYKIKKADWRKWLDKITDFCEREDEAFRKCYAENAFNEISEQCEIYPLDVKDMLCNEIDTPEDLSRVSEELRHIMERTVYVSFSTDMIHSGHIALIKKARRLGKLIVGVISDEVVASYKRYPMLPFEERKVLFENIKGVKAVVEQNTLSYKDNIEKYRPTFVVHGDDWKEGFQKPVRDEVISLLSEYGGKLIEFPYASDPKYKNLERQISYNQKMIYIRDRYDMLDDYLRDSHVKKLMFVCGQAVEYHPLFRHIMQLEDSLKTKIIRFSDYTPNPDYESVKEGVRLFTQEECDSILVMGGGSAIDVAKSIKLFACMDHTQDYLNQRIEENDIPLWAIPTTAGTGSEVTRFAVIYHNGVKQSITHESCVPSMVFVDDSFLKTVPMYHRKSTMMDALCHSIESFWSVNATEESKAYAREAVALILDNQDSYLQNETQGNINMQRAAQLAGKAINITQTTAGHAMCYKLTSLYKIAHGHAAALCNVLLWSYMLQHTVDCIDRRGERYLKQTLRELATAFECDTPEGAVEKFRSIVESLDLEKPKCGSESELDELANTVKAERLRNHPVALSGEVIRELYRKILLY